jgi:hypothetical protein
MPHSLHVLYDMHYVLCAIVLCLCLRPSLHPLPLYPLPLYPLPLHTLPLHPLHRE